MITNVWQGQGRASQQLYQQNTKEQIELAYLILGVATVLCTSGILDQIA